MRVLLSAYACAPGYGSEPEVGLRVLEAVAQHHKVWLLTEETWTSSINEWIQSNALANITIVGLRCKSLSFNSVRNRGKVSQYVHYEAWQRIARRAAVTLDQEIDFDVVHHVTYANYWAGMGVTAVPKPLLVGPLGGGVRVPFGLLPLLKAKGVATEVGRQVVQAALGLRFRRLRTRPSTEFIFQNMATRRRCGGVDGPIVPNATLVTVSRMANPEPRNDEIVVGGVLEPWKGGVLAVRAFAQIASPDTRLIFYGSGTEEARIRREAAKHGVADRVVIGGHIPRDELLDRVARARLFLHPALREEGALAIAEALTVGTPVVALGQSASAFPGLWQTEVSLVQPSGPRRTATRLARAIDNALVSPGILSEAEPRAPLLPVSSVVLQAYERLSGSPESL